MMTGLIVALDDPDLPKAEALAEQLQGRVVALKVGLTLFSAYGPESVRVISRYAPVFCDAKLHDIPMQVGAATSELARAGAWMITVHASGGAQMVEAAVRSASASDPSPLIAAVTVLTSIGPEMLSRVGQGEDVASQVERLASLAISAGATALVCSAQELGRVKPIAGDAKVVVPGIRPAGSDPGDQARVMTPAEAKAAGADLIVVGRPITGAPDPVAALEEILRELA